MADDFDTDQLVEFCQRLGLAKDGYLDEKELTTVCNCIGLDAPEEVLKELFDELDGDKDGRVCLNELSQMLRGMTMAKGHGSPEKRKKPIGSDVPSGPNSACSSVTKSSSGGHATIDYGNVSITNGDRSTFSILDPHNSGFTKVGAVVEMWGSWGISSNDAFQLLKDLGFGVTSKNSSVNVQDLTKALDEEMDNSKDALPLNIQTALLTYKTETQYLRSICEGMGEEREKLKADVLEAHRRNSVIAQEVDEQNARFEKNSQLLLQKMEAKYLEQVHELQEKYLAEKEALTQALSAAETQLKTLQEDDNGLKSRISKLKNDNAMLEREVNSLNNEITNLSKVKQNLEREISRYMELEAKMMDVEHQSSETLAASELRVERALCEVQRLRDQNDELTNKIEVMRDKIKVLKGLHERRVPVTATSNKRRKGGGVNNSANKYFSWNGSGMDIDNEIDDESPLEKIGKFHIFENGVGDDAEEYENPIDAFSSQPDSGNFPVPFAVNLAACMGETSTDSLKLGSQEEYKTLERDMDAVKEKIQTILVENQCLKHELERSGSKDVVNCVEYQEVETQTTETATAVQSSDGEPENTPDSTALEQLREEYENCEIYWSSKLQETREFYEQDRLAMDAKFLELLNKIKDYEETFMGSVTYPQKLPPIEERASLEQQVNELEQECIGLREELFSLRHDKDSIVTNYQKQFESRALEESSRLEAQVMALTKKCQEYESRLSSLAEEERGAAVEDNGLLNLLQARVRELEYELQKQEQHYHEEILKLEEKCRTQVPQSQKNDGRMSAEENVVAFSTVVSSSSSSSDTSPTLTHQPVQMWTEDNRENSTDLQSLKQKSQSLLQLLQKKADKEDDDRQVVVSSSWPEEFNNNNGPTSDMKSVSLPFVTSYDAPISSFDNRHNQFLHPNDGVPPIDFLDPWNLANAKQQKMWCHVELGWLQDLRLRLKQREDQCSALSKSLQQKDNEMEKALITMKYKHEAEISNYDQLIHASQEIVRQQAKKYKEQSEKLAHSELLVKNLWLENTKLSASRHSTEQRIVQLENLLKYHMSLQHQQQQGPLHQNQHESIPPSTTSSPKSLPFQFPPKYSS